MLLAPTYTKGCSLRYHKHRTLPKRQKNIPFFASIEIDRPPVGSAAAAITTTTTYARKITNPIEQKTSIAPCRGC